MDDNNSSMVPVIAPDGSTGTVPHDQLGAAINAGGKLGIRMLAPDGSPGTIPVDRVHDAIKAGGQLAPPKLTVGSPASQPMQQVVPTSGAPVSTYQATPAETTPQGSEAAVTQREAEHPVISTVGKTVAPVAAPISSVGVGAIKGAGNGAFGNPEGILEGVGSGIEGIGEFILGNEVSKGIPLLQRAESALKAQKALKIAAEESPLVQQILSLGLKAVRTGAVSGAQSYLHEPTAASAGTGAVFGAAGELGAEAAQYGISKLLPRTVAEATASAKDDLDAVELARLNAGRQIGNIATRTAADATGEIISDTDNFRGAAEEIRKTFDPIYDRLRQATGGVLNPSTGRYSANAFDDATQQIARAKKVIYSPNPISTDAIKQAEGELADGETKLQKLFDSGTISEGERDAAKAAWRKAATLDELHGYIDKAFSEPAGVRELSSGAPAKADPKKFVQQANKAIDKIGKSRLVDAMGTSNFEDLQQIRSRLGTVVADRDYGLKLDQAAREYLRRAGAPSSVSKTLGAPATGGSVAALAHLLGASNPVTAGVGSIAGIIGWLYTHPDQGVKVLGLVEKSAPLAAQAAKQVAGPAITHVFDPDSGEVQPTDQQ